MGMRIRWQSPVNPAEHRRRIPRIGSRPITGGSVARPGLDYRSLPMQIRSSSCCCAGDHEATSEPACTAVPGGFYGALVLAQQFSHVKGNVVASYFQIPSNRPASLLARIADGIP